VRHVVRISLGRAAFSAAVSNLSNDSSSDIKYWHICRVMGRVASHLALEVALQTHANLTLIGEDLADYVDEQRLEKARAEGTVDYTAYGMTLRHLSRVICDAIVRRAAVGKNYGVGDSRRDYWSLSMRSRFLSSSSTPSSPITT
jgi:diphosphate-dependent phosphofructokinase